MELQCSLQRERHFDTVPAERSQSGAAAFSQAGMLVSTPSKSTEAWEAGEMGEEDGLLIGAVWMRCASQSVSLELF